MENQLTELTIREQAQEVEKALAKYIIRELEQPSRTENISILPSMVHEYIELISRI